MKKLVVSNVLIFLLVLLYWQINVSMLNYIHFIPWQSLFSRSDYLLIFFICLGLFLAVLVAFIYIYKSLKEQNIVQILNYELLLTCFIGLSGAIFYIYKVLNPPFLLIEICSPVLLIEICINNEPYLVMVVWYFIECIFFLLMIWKILKRIKTNKVY